MKKHTWLLAALLIGAVAGSAPAEQKRADAPSEKTAAPKAQASITQLTESAGKTQIKIPLPAENARAATAGRALVGRKCWNYRKELVTLAFSGADRLTLSKNGNSCVVLRDRTYPGSHVPPEYKNWFRYHEDAKIDASTNYGKDNPCTRVFGELKPGSSGLTGVFTELRLDSALSDENFRNSASMIFQAIGDGAGPVKDKFICR